MSILLFSSFCLSDDFLKSALSLYIILMVCSSVSFIPADIYF